MWFDRERGSEIVRKGVIFKERILVRRKGRRGRARRREVRGRFGVVFFVYLSTIFRHFRFYVNWLFGFFYFVFECTRRGWFCGGRVFLCEILVCGGGRVFLREIFV